MILESLGLVPEALGHHRNLDQLANSVPVAISGWRWLTDS